MLNPMLSSWRNFHQTVGSDNYDAYMSLIFLPVSVSQCNRNNNKKKEEEENEK